VDKNLQLLTKNSLHLTNKKHYLCAQVSSDFFCVYTPASANGSNTKHTATNRKPMRYKPHRH
jgi:hypothetical protein